MRGEATISVTGLRDNDSCIIMTQRITERQGLKSSNETIHPNNAQGWIKYTYINPTGFVSRVLKDIPPIHIPQK